MTTELKPYPVMKPSGVEWLGDVPEYWEVRRLKKTFRRIVGGSTPSSGEAGYWDGEIVWVTPTDVSHAERLRTSGRRITRDGLRSCSSELVPAGSVVVTSRAPVGNVALAETELCTNQGCKALVIHEEVVTPSFGLHVLKTLKEELQSLATGTTFTEISTSQLGIVALPLPPLPEQAAIVRYVDHVDRRINRYVRAKRRLIELLEEQKQTIIHRTVTRGLDPDVRLKPSGVEWMGDVPEHWDVRRSRYVFREVDRRSREGLETHLSMSQKLGLIPSSGIEGWRLVAESYVGAKLCEPGDIVLNRLKAHLGVFALAREAGMVSADYTILRPRIDVDSRYFEAVYRTTSCRVELRKRTKGIVEGFWRLYTPDFFEVPVPVPPVAEQFAITLYLDSALGDVDRSVERIKSELTLLNEYRTRLIADVVTGKLDVREAAADLPEVYPADLKDIIEIDDVAAEELDAELEEVAT